MLDLGVPGGGAGDGLLEIPYGTPAQEVEGFLDGEIEERGLVGRVRVGAVLPVTGAVLEDFTDELGDGAV